MEETAAPPLMFASPTPSLALPDGELRVALDEILTRLPDYTVPDSDALVYDNVSVRAVTRLPVVFTPATA